MSIYVSNQILKLNRNNDSKKEYLTLIYLVTYATFGKSVTDMNVFLPLFISVVLKKLCTFLLWLSVKSHPSSYCLNVFIVV